MTSGFFVEREDWMDEGVCHLENADPNIFIMDQGFTAAEAKKYCIRCTVTLECELYARRTGSIGVWGGKLFTQRYPEPVELLPVIRLQDARPVSIASPLRKGQAPSILGEAASFRHPGILG